MIAIVDYGVGNLRSVERALLHVGATPKLTADQDELQHADGMVLPGVGAFAPALEKLSDGGLGRRVVELARKGKPVLGVCLGYQLLFEESMENGRHQGLGLLEGRVVKVTGTEHVPVSYFYFVHSYTPDGSRNAIASTEQSPAAAAARLNVMGTQFHPEKSGADGLRVYENFVALCG